MIFEAPEVVRLRGPFGCALTVDVEEWYHTCLVPGYVNPEGRPSLPQELDWLLPELLKMMHEARCTATHGGDIHFTSQKLPHGDRERAADV